MCAVFLAPPVKGTFLYMPLTLGCAASGCALAPNAAPAVPAVDHASSRSLIPPIKGTLVPTMKGTYTPPTFGVTNATATAALAIDGADPVEVMVDRCCLR